MIVTSPSSSTGPPGDAVARFAAPLLRVLPPGAGRPALHYALAMVDVAMFSPALYTLAGISLPAHIAQSVPKRQAEFLAGRLCARAALSTLGQGALTVGIGTHREPLWPPGVVGSISHNGSFAAAIACPAASLAGIGIDIESVIGEDTRGAMAELVVSHAELAYLDAACTGLSLDCLLTLVFSAKESFFKAAFAQVRSYFDFDAVCVIAIDTVARTISLQLVQGLAPGLAAGAVHQASYDLLDGGPTGAVFTVLSLAAPCVPANFDSYAAVALRV
ncbi:MAG: 4'-phosphopantetheinyl transferase superfamily protein [Pseudomonadota bacterium]